MDDVNELFAREFTAAEICTAAGILPETLQNWIKRDIIVGEHASITGGGARGTRRTYDFNALMQIAVTKVIANAGFGDLKIAALAGAKFAHMGRGVTGFAGKEPTLAVLAQVRNPGLPHHYAFGDTMIYVAGDDHRIKLLKKGDQIPVAELQHDLGQPGFFMMNATDLFIQVGSKMGFKPYEVLDQAYAQGAAAVRADATD